MAAALTLSKTWRATRIKELITFSEAQWQHFVLVLADRCDFLAYHTYDSRRSQKGFPDLVLVKPPRVLFVELKTEKGRLRREQKEWAQVLKLCPGISYYLWRPSDLQEVKEVLLGR